MFMGQYLWLSFTNKNFCWVLLNALEVLGLYYDFLANSALALLKRGQGKTKGKRMGEGKGKSQGKTLLLKEKTRQIRQIFQLDSKN